MYSIILKLYNLGTGMAVATVAFGYKTFLMLYYSGTGTVGHLKYKTNLMFYYSCTGTGFFKDDLFHK
jgi:hypothetical protein